MTAQIILNLKVDGDGLWEGKISVGDPTGEHSYVAFGDDLNQLVIHLTNEWSGIKRRALQKVVSE
jgi:hypothetical protein